MDVGDLEALALSLFRELDEDPERPPGTQRLARRWLGAGSLQRVHMVGQPSSHRRDRDRVIIVVRPTVAPEYLDFYVGHELGHELLRRSGYVGDDEEACADYLGAALMMPRAFVVATHRAEGFSPEALAEGGRCTQTAAALRLAEVLGLPMAAVSPGAVRVRGPEAFVWPEEPTIRGWATARKDRPGLARVRLTDQPKRVALLADEDATDGGAERDVG